MEVGGGGALKRAAAVGLPKLREIFRRQRRDSEPTFADTPDLDFLYEDADKHHLEISELYSYTEENEFKFNQLFFEELLQQYTSSKWCELSSDEKRQHILRLMELTDISDRSQRMKAVRSYLYLVQGVFGEGSSEQEVWKTSRDMVFLLYKCGVFTALVELLYLEIDNSTAASAALRKPAVSLADSTDLRVIICVLYIMVENARVEEADDDDATKQLINMFRYELGQPILGDDLLAVVLFGMVTKFCSGSAPHFPIKKVLLLLWKTILVSLGGMHKLFELKNAYRADEGLGPVTEDTVSVTRTMRAASPPASAADLIEQQQQRRPIVRARKGGLIKQSSLDDDENGLDEEVAREMDNNAINNSDDEIRLDSPCPGTPPPPAKGLPWTPKVRQRDLDAFLDYTREKFVGFQVQGDRTSLAGLPQPIHEGIKVLTAHLYVSLAEVQVKREEEIAKHPMSKPECNVMDSPTELLYQHTLPSLAQYMIALLKILLAAAPTSKAKTDSINIMADVLPEEMPMTVLQSMKLGIDVNRHKEIIVKAISSILLLLLKHFKINHIYQFEFMSQHLVFANCIPLVLKFFNQNIMAYITAKNTISLIDYPRCVIGDQPELTADTLEATPGDMAQYCWRNLYSCINLLRILNKLTKWKHSRTMMLVVFKSAPILKRALKVKQVMMQLYVLKLLKAQTKYLGRQWRKSNMKTMSAIYQKVRHRLNDDWAFGNDVDARPWDFQAEECALRACVDRFNNRRYSAATTTFDPEFQPVDNNLQSVLGRELDLGEEFKCKWEAWVDREVINSSICWEQLLVD
ncbi:PREDICTED: striatin-interacting protein 1 homolog isoform X2 [Priapulus caudatus]|uniref:Striatin-interacting protein 1 homolog isoform X2 n=1 Tax=Priapulus caudatus TaxID=37621 RepID=A0ABM1F2Q4_PRICU|nr:PREDICTED: striatin-interacting protein 1 homolog isoform X2 [Priapulus caudatus]